MTQPDSGDNSENSESGSSSEAGSDMANDTSPIGESQINSLGNVGARKTEKTGGPIRRTLQLIKNRVLAGIFLALPVIITMLVIQWLYEKILRPLFTWVANFLLQLWTPTIEQVEPMTPGWLINVLAYFAAGLAILGAFFLMGMFFQSRLHRLMDWTLNHVPGVGKIYSSVNNVVNSIRKSQSSESQFQRTVLVEFPHPGMRVPAFVTSSCEDKKTGKTILCVYVPTTPIPTSGYMLLIPAENVTELSWDLQETLQAIVSGGITVPDKVDYFGSPMDQFPAAEN